jgi:hypothetical protein
VENTKNQNIRPGDAIDEQPSAERERERKTPDLVEARRIHRANGAGFGKLLKHRGCIPDRVQKPVRDLRACVAAQQIRAPLDLAQCRGREQIA